MHEALDVVEVVVHPSLENTFKVFLELFSGGAYEYPEGPALPFFKVLDIGADNCNFSIFNHVIASYPEKLCAKGLGPAELGVHVILPYPLPLVNHSNVNRNLSHFCSPF